MITADRKPFAEILGAIHTMKGKEMSPIVLSVWFEAMRPFDFDTVRDALNRHIVNPDNGQFIPTPADVVRLIGGGTQDAALLAWSKVDRCVRSVGTYESVCFDDPIINAVISDMGGWVGLGTKTEDEWPFIAREFEQRYRGYRTRGKLEDYPRLLGGITAQQNGLEGYRTSEPVLIGDEARARAVYEGGSVAPKLGFSRALIEQKECAA